MVLAWLLALALPLSARLMSAADRYPEARTLLLEAESDIPKIPDAKVRSNSRIDIAGLFARAGYLEDAASLYAKTSSDWGPYGLAIGQAVYVDTETALRTINAAKPDPYAHSLFLTRLVLVLWRLGRVDDAERVLVLAGSTAAKITVATKRAAVLRDLSHLKKNVRNEPPNAITFKPSPPAPRRQMIDPFPITAEGFRKLSPAAVANRHHDNQQYIEKLYALVSANDLKAAYQHVLTGKTDVQRAFGFATLQHLAMQVPALEFADGAAHAIPDDKSDSTLARAEALSSLAVAHAKGGNAERASECFEAAKLALRLVSDPALAFGKVIVLARTGVKQSMAGFASSAGETVEEATKLAELLPQDKERLRGIYTFDAQLRDDALREVLLCAVEVKDLARVRLIAKRWHVLEGDQDATGITRVLLDGGLKEDALAFVRSLKDPKTRAEVFTWAARDLLDSAGAPFW